MREVAVDCAIKEENKTLKKNLKETQVRKCAIVTARPKGLLMGSDSCRVDHKKPSKEGFFAVHGIDARSCSRLRDQGRKQNFEKELKRNAGKKVRNRNSKTEGIADGFRFLSGGPQHPLFC